MLNNQIIVTDDSLRACARRKSEGVIDAAELTDDEWSELCARNINSTRARLVKCGFCWVDHQVTQWMKTFNRMGTRVISHQAGEALDHPYQSVETPEHKAYNNRAFIIGEAEGYKPRREAFTADLKTRADVLLTGTVTIAYEHQHSPFRATGRYSAPERNRLATAAGRTVMWHATSDKVRGQVPILRTDDKDLPPQVIENPNYRHEFRGGIYRIEIYTCTVRDGHQCPSRRFSGCGQAHARGQVTAGQLDDVLRGAPIGAYMPVLDANVIGAPRFFWTDRNSYDEYTSALGDGGNLAPLNGASVDKAKTRTGIRNGHSRGKEAELEAMRAQAFDLTALATLAPGQLINSKCPLCGRPVDQGLRHECARFVERPGPGFCGRWLGLDGRYCAVTEGVRHYLPGHRCPAHTPAALMGIPEPEPGPGWPRLRKAAGQ